MGNKCCCGSIDTNTLKKHVADHNDTEQTDSIMHEIDELLDSFTKNRENDDSKEIETITNKLLKLIETNEETQNHAFKHLIKINNDNNTTKIDGDETKDNTEFQRKLVFDNTTLEKRLKNFKELVYTPNNITELVTEMQKAVNEGRNIKAMGSRYGFGNVTFTEPNGLLIDMYNSLNDPNMKINLKSLNKYGKEIYDKNNLHLCQSGAQIQMLTEALWPKNKRRTLINEETGLKYKAIKDIGGYDQLCIGGLMNVGGAGEGLPWRNKKKVGSFLNQILAYSMIIIDEQKKVRLVQIEPSVDNGCIHDALLWKHEFVDIELIQNDDIFEAGLVSIGLLGVTYSYYIELNDAYFIEEKPDLVSLDELRTNKWGEIKEEILNDKIEAMELLISPYTLNVLGSKFRESVPVLVKTYSKTDKIPPEKFTVKNSGAQQNPGFVIRSAAVVNNWLSRTIPEIMPFMGKFVLQTQKHDGIVKPCTMLGSAGYNALSVPTKTVAFAFTYQDDKFFQFIDNFVELIGKIRTNDRHQTPTMPLAVRFSSYECKGLLNMFNGNSSDCYFWLEFIVPHFEGLATVENENHLLYKVSQLCASEPYFGNPHWGMHYTFNKDNNEANSFKNIKENKLNKFIEIYKKYNQTKTFCNEFTKQSGLDMIAQL